MFKRAFVYAIAAAIIISAANAARAITYEVNDLTQYYSGAESGGEMFAHGISTNGQYVTGMVDSPWHAFRYQVGDSAISEITIAGQLENQGNGVNNSGQVSGFYHDAGTEPGFHADPFIATSGSGNILPAANSGSVKINNNGQIAGMGEYWDELTGGHMYLMYYDGTVHDLGLTNSMNFIGGINDNSWIAGGALVTNGAQAFVNKPLPGGGRQTFFLDFFPGGNLNNANGINNSGKVVGGGMTGGQQHAFLSVPDGDGYGPTQDLGTLGETSSSFSNAEAINNNDWIVGQSDGAGFLAINNGSVYVMQDLNDLLTAGNQDHWTIQDASGIADNGRILALARHDNSSILVPVLLMPITVPEPSTLALLAAGSIVLISFAWRKRRRK